MSLWDFSIIYLSMGAPFLVYFYHQMANRRAVPDYFRVAGRGAAWPVFGVALIFAETRRRLSSSGANDSGYDSALFLEADAHFAAVEAALMEIGRGRDARRGRYLFDRHSALAFPERTASCPDGFEKEFFKLAAHRNEDIASRCLRRRNLRKLARHQINARRDLTEFIRPLLESDILEERLKGRLAAFAEILEFSENLSQSFASETSNIRKQGDAPPKARRISQWVQHVKFQQSASERAADRRVI